MPRSLKKIALVVSLGTICSKSGGLIRQLVLAGAFGVGAAYDAYNYAYILPGFLLILLGGINGPFHNAMVSVLSKRPSREASYVITTVNSFLGSGLLAITIILFIGADPLIKALGPGLNSEVHKIAVLQLQIMAPMSFFAGLIGLGFGSLNAKDEFLIPAISPLMSSIALITGVGIFWVQVGDQIGTGEFALIGGIILAISTLVGSLLQWLMQLPSLIKKGLIKFKLNWDFRHPGVKEVWRMIWPATLSSGMLQINVFTDLFFASGILGAASGLSYASLLVQAPLGLISNTLLVPLLPTLSRLASSKNKTELKKRIRQGLILSTGSMIILGGIFITLSHPIVALVYQRGAFNTAAVDLVSGLLIAYGIGMPFYLCRDLLVRIFYAIGDGTTPFRLSTLGIILNVLFDWVMVGGPTPWGHQFAFNLGAPGLVIATAAINFITCTALLIILNLKVEGLPVKSLREDCMRLLLAGVLSGFVSWGLNNYGNWPEGLLGLTLEVGIASATSILSFVLISTFLGVEEIKQAVSILKKRLIRQ